MSGFDVHRAEDPFLGMFADLGRDGASAKLGLMGGTFDPIHFGHLLCAEQARESFGLDGVLFIPTGDPSFKRGQASDPELRYEMACRATASNPHFDVSRIEIDRPGITYTVDTLNQLHALLPDCVELYFITGADAIKDIITWKSADEIAQLATFVGATRPGTDLAAAREAQERSDAPFDIRYLNIPLMDISSSDIRARVKEGKTIRYLTPDQVCDFIVAHNLYTGQ